MTRAERDPSRATRRCSTTAGSRFHAVDNDQLLVYSKVSPDGDDRLLVVVNLDPRPPSRGGSTSTWARLGLPTSGTFVLEDVLADGTHRWTGSHRRVAARPGRAWRRTSSPWLGVEP